VRVISKLISTATPIGLGIASIALVAYGLVITEVLPHWKLLHEANGGRLPGEAFDFGFDLAAFIDSLTNDQRADYIVLQILEVPFFFVQALVLSWAMALGIKARRWEQKGAASFLALPMFAVGADLAENLGLVLATLSQDAAPHWAYVLAATQLKFFASQIGLALAAFGFLIWIYTHVHARFQRP
jgi:hypothetical protein